jgi:hypothetical protein
MKEISCGLDLAGVGTGAVLGEIVRITQEDLPVVDYPGNLAGPIEARIAAEISSDGDGTWPPVVLVFENGDPTLPIIVGFVRRSMCSVSTLDGSRRAKRLVFNAEEEVLLRCGKSSVFLRRDGKIVIKGREIVSRAAGANKVQGATVRLN